MIRLSERISRLGKGFMAKKRVWEYDFFIAHAGPDTDAAEELYNLLLPGARVFLDSKTLLPGDDWDRELALAQKDSLISVVMISSRSGDAYYQREEIAAAISMAREDKKRHRVVPVYLEEISGDEVPYGLRVKHALSIDRHGGFAGVANQLNNLLTRIRPREPVSQQEPGTPSAATVNLWDASVEVYKDAILNVLPGQLVVRCGRCRGTGSRDRDGREPRCPVCDGAGRVLIAAVPDAFIRCRLCRGDGTRDRDGRDPACPVCNGVGGVVIDSPVVNCAACAGSGFRDRDGRLPICPACGGKGVRPLSSLRKY